MLKYCHFCGNKQVEGEACPECQVVLDGLLKKAFEIYQQLQEDGRQCCGGLSTEKDHLYYHDRHWSCVYPLDADENENTTSVEMGVKLYANHATTYWIFDNDTVCDTFEYGEVIPYGPTFVEILYGQLDQAAEYAWNSDVISCPHCGYHHHVEDAITCEESHNDSEDLNG